MRLLLVMMVVTVLATACGKKPQGLPSSPPPQDLPSNPQDPYVLQSELTADGEAEFELTSAGYVHSRNCLRLFKNGAGNRYIEFSEGSCVSPGVVQFTVIVKGNQLMRGGVEIGMFEEKKKGKTFPLYHLCTGVYERRCSYAILPSGVLKCLSPNSDGKCE